MLHRVIVPDVQKMSPALAEEILKWHFTEDDKKMASDLAAKARAGELTAEDRATIDCLGRMESFLGILHSKARQALKAAGKS
ncbi:hypothetical protein BH11PLA2_BH11PLA2_24830 [soil metagenome]